MTVKAFAKQAAQAVETTTLVAAFGLSTLCATFGAVGTYTNTVYNQPKNTATATNPTAARAYNKDLKANADLSKMMLAAGAAGMVGGGMALRRGPKSKSAGLKA